MTWNLKIDFPSHSENGLFDTILIPLIATDNPNGDPDRQNPKKAILRLRKILNFPPNFKEGENTAIATFKGKCNPTEYFTISVPKNLPNEEPFLVG